MRIEQIGGPAASGTSATQKLSEPDKGNFLDVLKKSVEKVNTLQNQADAAIDDLVLGDNKDIVQTMIKVEQVDISFRLMMQIRNKIVKAYEEVMRMQV
ncbi:flagellar hook-basal body complex protein FliE [Candidatus Poribacteria bacterium]